MTNSKEQVCREYTVGQKVRLLKDIWDHGQDHHPPGYLAHTGEVLIVRKTDPGSEFPLCVSHEHITDRSFRVSLDEVQAVLPKDKNTDLVDDQPQREVRRITGKFEQPPKVGSVYVNAFRDTTFIPRYKVTKVNEKSVHLEGVDRKLDFIVRISDKAIRAVFTKPST